MNKPSPDTHMVGRRSLLRAAAATSALVVAGAATPGSAQAAPSPHAANGQVPGVTTEIDTSHASTEVVRFFGSYFRAKSAPDLDWLMSHFAFNRPFRYLDAALGYSLDFPALQGLFAQVMPTWTPDMNSYATRIVGDARSAIVLFDDSAGMFGAKEIRVVSAVNMQHGVVTRQVDYWDSRHFGVKAADALRAPAKDFPTNWYESVAGEHAARRMRAAAHTYNDALRAGDSAGTARLFAPDAIFEDLTLHLRLVGLASIGTYLGRAAKSLPYGHSTTEVLHVLGSGSGGGYEWRSQGSVPRGLNVLELDDAGKITRLTAVWDGAFASDTQLEQLYRTSIER